MSKIYLPSRLRTATQNQAWVDVHADTIHELLHNLTQTFPALIPFIFQDGNLNTYTRVFVNNKEVRDLSQTITPTDEIHLIQAMAGG
jgi:molybdopterin synthase sulfur carrier subunit